MAISARAISKRLAPLAWRIIGTTRDPRQLEIIRASGAEPCVWPGDQPDLDGVTHLLISTAPTADGDPILAELQGEIAARAEQFKWVGYLSTTAVYGDHQEGGGWMRLLHPHQLPNAVDGACVPKRNGAIFRV